MRNNKIELPDELYRYRSVNETLYSEAVQHTPVEKLTWSKGVFLHLQGAAYPQKNMTGPETMWAINVAKRNFIVGFKLFSRWYMLPSLLLTPKNELMDYYVDTSWKVVSPYMLKYDYLTSISQELEWLVYYFTKSLGIKNDLAEKFGEIFAACIEYDNAYRFRLLDIFSETTKEKLVENPRKEIKRLIKILEERDSPGVAVKFRRVARLLDLLLLFPKIRKSFIISIGEIDIQKMQYDDNDRYWVCLRQDYKFMGKTDEERKEMIKDKSLPVLI